MASSHVSVTEKQWQRASVTPSPEDGHLSCATSHRGTGEVAIAKFVRPEIQFVQTMLVHTFTLRSPLLKEAAIGAGTKTWVVGYCARCYKVLLTAHASASGSMYGLKIHGTTLEKYLIVRSFDRTA